MRRFVFRLMHPAVVFGLNSSIQEKTRGQESVLGRGFFGNEFLKGELITHRAGLRLWTLFQGRRISLDEVTHRADNNITEGDVGVVGDRLQHLFFVRGNADCHDPVASFWHVENVGGKSR